MVAYSFQRRFADLIVSGQKQQTIRAHRTRHVRPGEDMQLYVGMRTKHCRKVADVVCESVENILIKVPAVGDCLVTDDCARAAPVSAAFAKADGFVDAADFSNFWRSVHGVGEFAGVLICWRAAALMARDTGETE